VKQRIVMTYRDEWTELVEVEIPDTATRAEADEIRLQAAERHWPKGPPSSRLSPCNLIHQTWEGDPQFVDERRS
jgi:hypothetical protein